MQPTKSNGSPALTVPSIRFPEEPFDGPFDRAATQKEFIMFFLSHLTRIVLVAVTGLAIGSAAQASLIGNGPSLDGVTVASLTSNGPSLDGVTLAALHSNGLSLDGMTVAQGFPPPPPWWPPCTPMPVCNGPSLDGGVASV
jgi:hypothetical protein